MLDQNLFDVQSAILSESRELNKYVPTQDNQEYQSEGSNYSVGKGFGSKEQGNFFISNFSWTNVLKDSTGDTFISTVIN